MKLENIEKMKDMRNIIVTNKNRYLKEDEVKNIAYYLYQEFTAPTTIKAAGKNKFFLILDERELQIDRYKKILKHLQNIECEFYLKSKIHTRRVNRIQHNDKRILEEVSLNKEVVFLNEEYPTMLKC